MTLLTPSARRQKVSGVEGVVGRGCSSPTAQARAVQAELLAAIRSELARLAAVRESALPTINASALELEVPAVGGGSEAGVGPEAASRLDWSRGR